MTDEYADMYLEMPHVGVEGLEPALASICGLDSSSNGENNPYFTAAHIVSQLDFAEPNNCGGMQMLSFVTQSDPAFRDLLYGKDPVAVVLLARWYKNAGEVLWWAKRRAELETEAIRMYIKKLYGESSHFLKLIPPPGS